MLFSQKAFSKNIFEGVSNMIFICTVLQIKYLVPTLPLLFYTSEDLMLACWGLVIYPKELYSDLHFHSHSKATDVLPSLGISLSPH